MKKIYFFLLAMLVSFAASAETYVNAPGAYNSWGDNGVQPNASGDATITVTNAVGGQEFKIKVWDGSDRWYSNGESLSLDTGYVLTGDNDAAMKLPAAIGTTATTINIKYNVNTNTLKVVVPSAGETVITYALHGSFTGSWASTDLTNTSDSDWSISNLAVTNTSAEFGIKQVTNGSQTAWYAATSSTTISGSTSLTLASSNTKNINIAPGTYNITFNAESLLLTVTLVGEGGGGGEPTYPAKLYMIGQINDGSWVANVFGAEATPVSGVYTYSNVEVKGTFGFATQLGSNADDWATLNANRYGSGEGDNNSLDIVAGTSYDLKKDAGSFAIGSGTYNVEVDWTTMKVKLTAVGGGEPGDYEKFYVVGEADVLGNWGADGLGLELNTADGVTYTLNTDKVFSGEFKIWNGSWALNFGGDGNDANDGKVNMTLGTAYSAWSDSSNNFNIAESDVASAPRLLITFVYNSDTTTASQLTVTTTTGIDAVEAEAVAAPVYYNLQGVQVANPTQGLYIVVRGGKVTKELVK